MSTQRTISFEDELLVVEQAEPTLARILSDRPRPASPVTMTLWMIAAKLACARFEAGDLQRLLGELASGLTEFSQQVDRDIAATLARDPACRDRVSVVLFYKGYLALQSYRLSHHLWQVGRSHLAHWLQSRSSEVFGVDIHPAAHLGSGIFIDHATSVVIGETTVVEDDVSILHEVTLGGTGKHGGDRHPKVQRGVMIGAGVKVLGNVVLGEYSKVGAGSVLLQSIPPHSTAVGVPARVVGNCSCGRPADEMDQWVEIEDEEDGSR